MPILETRELSIRFGGVQAQKDVSVSLGEWEIVGIIGPNGAGKTTLFNMITGFYAPNSGRVIFKGEDVTDLPVHKRCGLGLGRTFQNVGMVKGSTVRDNMLTAQHREAEYGLVSGMLGLPDVRSVESLLDARAMAILGILGLAHLVDETVNNLPYGDLKRLEIAVVLATDPDALLLDEPSSGMGPEESDELGRSLLRLREEFGLSIMMIDHHVPLIVAACDYAYCLDFGQVLTHGLPAAVRDHPKVTYAYLGEEPEEEDDWEGDLEAPVDDSPTVQRFDVDDDEFGDW